VRRFAVSGALALLVGIPVAASAQGFAPAKGDDALRFRQASMFLMAQHLGALGAMVKGDKPWDAAAAELYAERVAMFSQMPWDAFWVPGSDKGKNRMKPEIFKEKEKFLDGAKHLQDETAKLVSVVKSGDQGAVKAQYGAVGKACKQCHDNYREE
jgi:cytochrome c556